MAKNSLAVFALVCGWVFSTPQLLAQQPEFRVNQGDHVALIGNTLAERMQHDGFLESVFQSSLDNKLVFRNLGFSADTLTVRLRSRNFGTPDEWLTKVQADTVFAFFGYNESFAGDKGLEKFNKDLEAFIKKTLSQKYNGDSAPQLVVFSPIACEDIREKSPIEAKDAIPLANPNTPDFVDVNQRLETYTSAMRKICESNGVRFVDLFQPTKEAFAASEQFTMNGIHLNEKGNAMLAEVIFRDLVPEQELGNFAKLLKVRPAVQDKNFHWFHRYRTTDGFSTYGGRADLKFVDGQTNREVVQRELEVLDFMTAERDKKIHAISSGSDYTVDDSKAPPFIPVISNKPGEGPNGTHVFKSGEDAIADMELHENMEVNLFASEEQFPELASPVQMSFDTQGRLWVAAWPTYPHWKPIVEEMNDKLLILKDTDNDGKADEVKVFADKLHNPTGFEFWGGGVLVAQIPDLLFLKDTDGDDVADVRIRVLHGLDSADTHHAANSFVIGPGGALYFQEGTFHHTQIETPWRNAIRTANGAVFRFEPRTFKLDAYTSYGFANPHGHVFDEWGQDFITDGTGNINYYAAPFTGHVEYPRKHARYFPFFQQWVRPAGATEILSSDHFPEQFQGNYLIVNVIGFQGILHYEVRDDGSGFSGHEVKPILKSSDANFRPVDIEVGPDGAIYLLDWQNPIIGHMQHNLRDPNRDKVHGRVYRVTYKDRPLTKVKNLATFSISELLDELKVSGDRERYRARIELSSRESDLVLGALKPWVEGLDQSDDSHIHHLLEGLWVSQQHNQVDVDLLQKLLICDDHRARSAATRVLCYTRDDVSNHMDLLQVQVNDAHPRVRLEAIRALSFVPPSAESAEIALQALKYPSDKFIDYCLKETLGNTTAIVKQKLTSGAPFAVDNPAGLKYVMDSMTAAEITQLGRNETVYQALLSREGVLHQFRLEAAEGLAKINDTDANLELLAAIERLDKSAAPNAESVLADLTHVFLHGEGKNSHGAGPRIDFSQYRDALVALATDAKRSVTREVAYSTLISAEKSADRLWSEAVKSPARFGDFVRSLALVDDPEIKAQLAPRVTELLNRLPMEIERGIDTDKLTEGRYIRIELPGKGRILTLAEVELLSGGQNVAPRGKATQSSVKHGGNAQRAIDGNKDPDFNKRGHTHTQQAPDQWWELDMGQTMPMDGIVIWNRNNGALGKRLDGFTIKVLDENRHVVFVKTNQPAPDLNVQIVLEGDPRTMIRNASIAAAVHLVPGEGSTFNALADFVLTNKSRVAAVRGLSRLPKRSWAPEKIKPLVGDIISRVSSLPASMRTETDVVDEISLGKKLTTALPGDEAKQMRSELNELGVNVIVLRPIPHRMQYDQATFFVEAGKPFQLILDNTDIMPHNVVITQPGAYAKVGIAAELMATDKDARRKGYVPNMKEVLYASDMLQPTHVQRMDFTAPKEPGEYPYVCTYPGHWRRMYGVMHVVEDLENAPIESIVPTVDSDIAMRPFVREWNTEELLAELKSADQDRSFEQGRALFMDLSCAQCHKVGAGEGGEVGPNLADLKAKFESGDLDRAGLLKSLIEPSDAIEEKYRSWIIQDIDGKVHTGVVSERTDDSVTLVANPLDNGKPVTIDLDDIEDELESKISMMPAGLLNTCTKEEILDLLMYVEAAGNPDHPAFKK